MLHCKMYLLRANRTHLKQKTILNCSRGIEVNKKVTSMLVESEESRVSGPFVRN